jgi:LruC domain-containing protein
MSANTIKKFQYSVLCGSLLVCLPSPAANYTFPGNLPSVCSPAGSGSYQCSALTLAAGDTMLVSAPTRITVNGAFGTGDGARINAGGLASNLTLIATGAITLGANNDVAGTIGANTAAINVGANSRIDGALAVTGAGAITLDANVAVTGGVSTDVGAITTGANSMIVLNIIAYDGAITVGANSTVGGSVCTVKTAAITVGASSIVGGNVETATAGAITIGALTSVKGAVTVMQAGGVPTIGAQATVGGIRIGPTCGIFDSDGDGISDSVDEFPNDASKASSRWYPSSSTYGTVAYEDNWPVLGDYDLNDIVVRYRSRQILNVQSQITALEMDVRLDARGGAIQSGFALALPGVAPDQITKVVLTQTKGGITMPVTRTVKLENVNAEDGGVVFEIFTDALELMPPDNSPYCLVKGYSNTGQGCPIQDSAIFKLTVELKSGSNNFPPPPYDPFVFHTVALGTEIHLPGRQPTSRANKALLGTGNDASTLGADKKYSNSYLTKTGLPWVLDVPNVWAYPYERLDAVNSYPGVAPWANSAGSTKADWYFAPAAANQTFSNGR